MLVRSQRPGLHSSVTESHVGPGAYTIEPLKKISSRFSVAPFGSTSVKLPLEGIGSVGDTKPGPGAYNPIVCQSAAGLPRSIAVHQSSAFASRIGRFNQPASAVPGPGTYDAQLPASHNTAIIMSPPIAAGGRGLSPVSASNNNNNNAAKRGGGVDWVKVATAPSIPCGPQSFGYEEGPGGALVQQPAPYHGHDGTPRDLPDAGEYQPSFRAVKPSTQVPTFAVSRSQRTDPAKSNTRSNLGPGCYSYENTAKPNLLLASAKSAFNSRTERIFVPGSDLPGPGEYNVAARSSFQDLKHYLAGHPEEFSVFGSSQAEARVPVKSRAPGPGEYDVARPSVVVRDKSRHNAVFTSSVDRFEADRRSTQMGLPGPGAYEIAEVGSLRDRLSKVVPNRYGAFGSTSRRFDKTKQANESAGNGGDDAAGAATAASSTSATRPASTRSASMPTSPVAYARDTRTSAFRPPNSVLPAVQARVLNDADRGPSYTDMRQMPDLWQKKSFSSTPSMYTSGPRLMSHVNSVPGPGSYDAARDALNKNGRSFNIDRRLPPGQRDAGPGPGSHFVPGSMLRPSFNVTFA